MLTKRRVHTDFVKLIGFVSLWFRAAFEILSLIKRLCQFTPGRKPVALNVAVNLLEPANTDKAMMSDYTDIACYHDHVRNVTTAHIDPTVPKS